MRLSIALLLTLCSTVAAGGAKVAGPTERARTFVQGQLDAMTGEDNKKMRETFTDDAVVIGGRFDSSEPISKMENANFYGALMNGSPHSFMKKSTIKSIAAGGDDSVLWVTAELVTTYNNAEPEEKPRNNQKELVRLTEVIVSDGKNWKAVAAVFDHPAPTSYRRETPKLELANKTKAGTLVPLLASPADLIKSLAADKNTFVIGSDTSERATGPAAAKKLLAKWTKLGLKLYGDVREVQTKTYAYAMSGVEFTRTEDNELHHFGMLALIIAVPDGTGWKVVGVHYAND